ncbi:MAG: SDR family NAD(P)-dependent oxidoreductase [Woeseiaceae bacterium]|nr:SDR family NAD(P)-dependent oxidoreductase [Woeseiaceae bacterium]
MSLNSLTANATVVVVGAGGGIGSEFVRQLSSSQQIGRVFALYRQTPPPDAANTDNLAVDIADEDSIRAAAETIAGNGPVDAVIAATGLLHDGPIQPEKSIAAIDGDAMLDVFRINTVGPVLIAKHFLPLLRRDARTLFAALSARVGSIADNRLGGWASYRASKAALNMLLRTAAIEHKRRWPESIVAALHPGTVDTPLSSPFQRRVPEGRLFTPAYSVERLLEVLDNLEPPDSGGFFAWDGQAIPF